MGQLFSALVTVVIGVGLAAAYFYAANKILDLIWPPRGPALQAARNQKISATIRPWLFLGPAIFFLGLYLVYPAINSLRLSFYGRSGVNFVGRQQLRLGRRRPAVPRSRSSTTSSG